MWENTKRILYYYWREHSITNKLRYALQSKFLEYFGRVKVSKFPPFLYISPVSFALKGIHYYESIQDLEPGDILLRGFDDYLDGFFIPGKYSHAGLYIGKMGLGVRQVIHAMSPDVQMTDLVTFMRAERIAVIRPNVSESDRQNAVTRAMGNLGKPYDYDFVFEEQDSVDSRFSCSELVWNAYEPVRKQLGWELTEKGFAIFGKKFFEPDKCLSGNVRVIYQADPTEKDEQKGDRSTIFQRRGQM